MKTEGEVETEAGLVDTIRQILHAIFNSGGSGFVVTSEWVNQLLMENFGPTPPTLHTSFITGRTENHKLSHQMFSGV
jgi:hypothetical protein